MSLNADGLHKEEVRSRRKLINPRYDPTNKNDCHTKLAMLPVADDGPRLSIKPDHCIEFTRHPLP